MFSSARGRPPHVAARPLPDANGVRARFLRRSSIRSNTQAAPAAYSSCSEKPPVRTPTVGTPARFSRTQDVGIRRLTPALGQDEDYVFGELLGLGRVQRADLEERGVIL